MLNYLRNKMYKKFKNSEARISNFWMSNCIYVKKYAQIFLPRKLYGTVCEHVSEYTTYQNTMGIFSTKVYLKYLPMLKH